MDMLKEAYLCRRCGRLWMVNYKICPECKHIHKGEGWIWDDKEGPIYMEE